LSRGVNKIDKERPYNDGKWTQGQMNSFIKSLLRSGTRRWGPKNETLKKARVEKGKYLCNGCKTVVPVTIVKNGKRVRFVQVDHVIPVVDSDTGFVSWDNYINRMFCNSDNYQLLCSDCHYSKTSNERMIATERKKRDKNTNE
jgi:hypothetical protein